MSRAPRKALPGILFIVCAVILTLWNCLRGPGLANNAYATGWILLGLMVFLALFNVRKKLPAPHLGRGRSWLKAHLYAGLFTVIAYALHAGFRWPTGILEGTLAALYYGLFLTGLLGWYLSRSFAKRMTTRGNEVIFEQIPAERKAVAESIRQLALESVTGTGESSIADFYERSLMGFLDGQKNRMLHLGESSRPLVALQREMKNLRRYLDADGKESLAQIEALVERKDALDYHAALQGLLKGWLFIHIPLTWMLMAILLLHVLVVYAFSGGAL